MRCQRKSVERKPRRAAILKEAALDSRGVPPVNRHTVFHAPVNSHRFRLFLLATFLLVFPFFLRRRPRVERRVTILAPPEAIFPFLNDLRNWPLWTVWSEREPLVFAYSENSAGTGAEQQWRGGKIDGALRILKSEENERIDYELEMDGNFAPVVGRIELHPDGACTRLVWKCAWDRAENPYRRYIDQFMRWLVGRDFVASLAKLKSVAESATREKTAA